MAHFLASCTNHQQRYVLLIYELIAVNATVLEEFDVREDDREDVLDEIATYEDAIVGT